MILFTTFLVFLLGIAVILLMAGLVTGIATIAVFGDAIVCVLLITFIVRFFMKK